MADFLRENGLDAQVDSAPSVRIAPRRPNGPAAVLEVDEVRYRRYLDHLAADPAPRTDPVDRARGVAMLQVLELLTTDHGDGVNHVRRLWLIDGEHGLRLVEERDDDPEPAPRTPNGPHDDPAVYAAELDTLAGSLRRLGLDASSDPAASVIRVGPRGRGPEAREVILELRPDLYRQYLDTLEAEFEAIGGDPFEHAWRSWCRLVVHALTGSSAEPRRLYLARSDDGQVALLADAPAAREWSAEPGH